jgi:hypothetical protein
VRWLAKRLRTRSHLEAELHLARAYAEEWHHLFVQERELHRTDLDLLTTALALLPEVDRRQLSAMVRTLDAIAELPEVHR